MSTEFKSTLNDSNLVIAANGFYFTASAPTFADTPAVRNALILKYSEELLRKGQSTVNKAIKEKKDPKAALAALASEYSLSIESDRLPTIGRMREEIAREMLTDIARTQIKGASDADIDASVTAALPAFAAKRAKDIDAALTKRLAEGYTPKEKGKSGETAAPKTATLEF